MARVHMPGRFYYPDTSNKKLEVWNRTYKYEGLIEYAARLCYMSLWDSDGEIQYQSNWKFPAHVVVSKGHSDVAEHLFMMFEFPVSMYDADIVELELRRRNRYISDIAYDSSLGTMYIYMNARVFIDLIESLDSSKTEDSLQFLTEAIPECNLSSIMDVSDDRWDLAFGAESIKLSWGGEVALLSMWEDNHMTQACFLIDNMSLVGSHQLVRHRTCSFSQLSRRYVDASKTGDWRMVIPPRAHEFENYLSGIGEAALMNYAALREELKKEDARYVIPTGMTTSMVFSGDERALRHFLKLRTDKAAQWEIRDIAEAIQKLLNRYSRRYW